ncbi:uncharacterized protein [Centruroides vittatus]|uniref:uncharacterized protein n=1 Tax=Centruroides vittatus TaxID=120091 RepID=UPI0035102F50
MRFYNIKSCSLRRILYTCGALIITLSFILLMNRITSHPTFRNFWAGDIVDFSNSNNVTGYPYPIVPDVVHYVRFRNPKLNFVDMINIKSVYINHKPSEIVIHCDCHNLTGKYWDMVKDIPGLRVQYKKIPTYIFGKRLSSVYHSSDIARLQILMKYGGVFLDSDVYVVKSLHYYRRFEFALGWPPKQFLGTQVLIAHRNSRFLKLWYQSYKYYRPTRWYYNAGELPTESILLFRPNFVHRVPYDFGVQNLAFMLYGVRSPNWRDYHTIHLLIRHRKYLVPDDHLEDFDENNIKTYNKTFGDMARQVLFGKSDMILV